MLVKDVMTRNVKSCGTNDSLDTAASLMWDGDCGAIPVVDENKRLVGILTDRDITMAAYTRDRTLKSIPVGTTMSSAVRTCRADDRVEQAEATMRTAQVRRLPVVNEREELVGILSLNDLMRAAVAPGRHAGPPQVGDMARTMAAICQPRSGPMVAAPAAPSPPSHG